MEIILSALADAILSIIIEDLMKNPRLASLREKIKGKSPEQIATQKALAKTYMRFASEYPELSASLFDENFLKIEIVQKELSKTLTPNQKPDIELISKKWLGQFNIPPKFDLIPPVTFFIDTFQDEVKASPLLRPFVDSRALDQLYTIAESSNYQSQIQSEIKIVLEEIRDYVSKAHQLQSGVLIPPSDNSPGNPTQIPLNTSEKEFIEHWILKAKQEKEFDESLLSNQFRAAMMLYSRTGLPQSLADKESAEKLTELISSLHPFLINQKDEHSMTLLEWGYQSSRATQNWKDMYLMVFVVAQKLINANDPRALSWVDRLEKLVPKMSEIKGSEVQQDVEGIFLEAKICLFRGIYSMTTDPYKSVEYFEKMDEKLQGISNERLSIDERESVYIENMNRGYLAVASKEWDNANELHNQKRYTEALQHYKTARKYIKKSNFKAREVEILIAIAKLFQDRNQENDFDEMQDVLSEAWDMNSEMSRSKETINRDARIMLSWGRGVLIMNRPKEDVPMHERIWHNLATDYKKNAPFIIKKLTLALQYATDSESNDLIIDIHHLLSVANFDLEEKNTALQHIRIVINLCQKENDLYRLKIAREYETRIKKSMSLFGF